MDEIKKIVRVAEPIKWINGDIPDNTGYQKQCKIWVLKWQARYCS